eukprot:SAG11_NODE_1804_length_4234_cov_20.948730_1_plen_41_part_00
MLRTVMARAYLHRQIQLGEIDVAKRRFFVLVWVEDLCVEC